MPMSAMTTSVRKAYTQSQASSLAAERRLKSVRLSLPSGLALSAPAGAKKIDSYREPDEKVDEAAMGFERPEGHYEYAEQEEDSQEER